jgi:hypothetical protein
MAKTIADLAETKAADVGSRDYQAWLREQPRPAPTGLSLRPTGREITRPFHAYVNSRPDVDWNTCGQAAIATITDFHGLNPYGLGRTRIWTGDGQLYWDDGEAIDSIINGGFGPDVVFGWGTTGGRITDALRSYGLTAEVGYSGLFSAGWENQWSTLQSYLAADLPVPVLVDLGGIGGPWYTAHWPVAYGFDGSRVFLANCGWNPAPEVDAFLHAWHAWFLPYGFNHCAVYSHAS